MAIGIVFGDFEHVLGKVHQSQHNMNLIRAAFWFPTPSGVIPSMKWTSSMCQHNIIIIKNIKQNRSILVER